MAFEGLAERLQGTLQKIRGKGKINEADVKEMMREVRFALIEADVNLKVVKEFVKTVSERAVGQDVMKSLTPGQQVVKIVKDELTNLMGGEQNPIQFARKSPTVIMMVGFKVQGKRRLPGNWRQFLRKRHNKKPLLVAADVYRPAAIQQLGNTWQTIDGTCIFTWDGYFSC